MGKADEPKPTMMDVARAAKVSQSCVSLVLNDTPGARLSKETRKRVRDAARALGYERPERRPRRDARSADAPKQNVFALIVDELSISPHAVLHADGARDAAWAAEALLQTYVTRGNAEIEAEAIAQIGRTEGVIGVIYATSFTRRISPPAALRDLPAVMANCYTPEAERFCPMLLPGELAGGFAATRHLLDHGHRRIGLIGGEAWMDAARNRLKGYREALTTHDIPPDPALVCEGEWSAASGYDRAMELMRLPDPPTAIFCANDMMAIGAMGALNALGLSIPGDVSLVGYNDIEIVRHLRPALTTVRVPSYEIGKRAVETLIEISLLGRPHRAMVTKLECPVIARDSVAPPRQGRAS